MGRALKSIASGLVTILVIALIIAFFFDWNLLAAWQWFWGMIVTVFDFFVDLFTNSEIFRGIFG